VFANFPPPPPPSLALHTCTQIYKAAVRERVEILDRVGGGDSFMSGVAAGFLNGKGPQEVGQSINLLIAAGGSAVY
jgi:sugar/nucleoside kinase (ribokinase family)